MPKLPDDVVSAVNEAKKQAEEQINSECLAQGANRGVRICELQYPY